MAIFKCKMCGGALEINDGVTVCECEYCGTKQTLPNLSDERKANLYDRANHFRRNNEYDKASSIYETILNDDMEDAEAYWSLVLCKYGIEYVEDPASRKRVPTVNRAQFTSVFADENYRSAIMYADIYQKTVYDEEARAIDEIQKGILAISEKEEPFDVFLCYKETDNNGRRTPDSVLATELYNELQREGFKVFFARITLEDKLGSAYEPYIFAALNSAKAMVVLGTKPEYFNAVWVKNEWSRYLSLIKNGERKVLIPAYKDMTPYDLPEEFSYLQAQDMSKLGFMHDLVHGIKKIASRTETLKQEPAALSNAAKGNVEPLLRRAFMFLEDGDWKSADEYCEKILDQEPENAQAYLGKLMAELRVPRRENLASCNVSFNGSTNFEKIARFGGEALVSELHGYLAVIDARMKEEQDAARLEEERKKAMDERKKAMQDAAWQTVKDFFAVKQVGDEENIEGSIEKLTQEIGQLSQKIGGSTMETLSYQEQSVESQMSSLRMELSACGLFDRRKKKEINEELSLLNSQSLRVKETIKETTRLIQLKGEMQKRLNLLQVKLDEMKRTDEQSARNFQSLKDSFEVLSHEEEFRDFLKGNSLRFGGMDWQILAADEEGILLITKKIVCRKAYNDVRISATWESCTLRRWLNNEFYNKFSAVEKARIRTTRVVNSDNAEYETKGGKDTDDKVFILSIDEAEKYFSSNAKRNAYYNGEVNMWWLRSPGRYGFYATCVNYCGDASERGYEVDVDYCGVRPALWINL